MTQLTTVSVAIDVTHIMRHTFEVDWDHRRLTHLRSEFISVPAPPAAEAEARQASRGSDPEIVVVERGAGCATAEDRWPDWCDVAPANNAARRCRHPGNDKPAFAEGEQVPKHMKTGSDVSNNLYMVAAARLAIVMAETAQRGFRVFTTYGGGVRETEFRPEEDRIEVLARLCLVANQVRSSFFLLCGLAGGGQGGTTCYGSGCTPCGSPALDGAVAGCMVKCGWR